MADTDKVSVTLEANTGNFKSNMQSAGQEATKLQQKIEELQRKADELSKRRENIRQSLISQYVSENGVGMGLVEKKLSTDKEYNKLGQQYDNIIAKVDTYKEKLQEASEVQGKIAHGLDNTEKEGGTALSKLANHMVQLSKKSNRLVLSLFSVRSAYSILSRASQSYLSADTKLSTQIKNAWFGLGALLAPVLEGLANMFTNLVTQVSAFVKALTGIDLIARANAKQLKAQAGATKALTDATLGFDELNIVKAGEGIGGAGGGVTGFTAGDVDTTWAEFLGEKLRPVYEWIKDIVTNHMPELKKVAIGVGVAIAGWKLLKVLSQVQSLGIALQTGIGGSVVNAFSVTSLTKFGLIGVIAGLGIFIVKTLSEHWPEIKDGFVGTFKGARDTIKQKGFWKGTFDGLTETWNGAMETLQQGAKKGDSALKTIGNSLRQMWNTAFNPSSTLVTPNSKKGFAEGGIITKPSRILVGEKAREAVVPLTNQKAMTQLANEIGQYASNAGNNTQPIQVTSVLQVDRKTLATAVNRANYEAGASITKGAFAL